MHLLPIPVQEIFKDLKSEQNLSMKEWCIVQRNQNIGLVVGATHPVELQRVRKIVPDMPILIPGIGKQGGDLKSAIRYGCDRHGQLAIINASRSIIYASSGKDFADAARTEARIMVEEIRKYMDGRIDP